MVRAIIAMTEGERLQKVLARGGVASRREAELLIAAGRVQVNGEVVKTLGTRVNPLTDRIAVDGTDVQSDELKYYLFHKPRGVVSTMSDPEGRPSLKEYMEKIGIRVFPVGRLDFHTSGALLITNDGALTNALLHPSKSVAKVYVAKVRGVAFDEQLQKMRDGVVLAPVADEPLEGKTAPAGVEMLRSAPSGEGSKRELGTTWLQVTLREGRNRQIHRMAEAVGLFVMRLARISFAGLNTEGLRAGQMRELSPMEITMLRKVYLGIEPPQETRRGFSAGRRDTRDAPESAERSELPRSPGGPTGRPDNRRGAHLARDPAKREGAKPPTRSSTAASAPGERRDVRSGAPVRKDAPAPDNRTTQFRSEKPGTNVRSGPKPADRSRPAAPGGPRGDKNSRTKG